MKKFSLFSLSVLVVLSILLSGCGPNVKSSSSSKATSSSSNQAQSSSNDTFNIGLSISLTGGTALFGEGVKEGASLAVKQFNAAGGYNGKKANLVIYDDEAKPEKSVEIVNRLIDQDHIVALIGPANSGNALAHIAITQKDKIPEVVPVATATAITLKYQKEPKNYIFRVSAVDSVQVGAILKELIKTKGYTKIGVIHDTTGYGLGGDKDILKQMKNDYNMAPTKDSAFDEKELNLDQPIRDMKKAGVQAIILYGLAPQAAKLLKARNKEGANDIPIYATWAMGDPTVVKLTGDLANHNVYFIQSFTVDQSDKAKKFDADIVKKYGKDVFPVAAAQGYDSANLILDAIKKAGLNGEKIRDQIENTKDFQGVTAVPSAPFTKTNHEAFGPNDVFMATYKDSKIVKAN